MAAITQIAESFFKACETGQGWQSCQQYCWPDATFSAQAEPLADVKTLEDYTEWAKAIVALLPDASYEVKAFATDEARSSVVAYAVFSGTHTGEGGPVPPTGKSMKTDYVYAMDFEQDKIRHMTKIWHSGLALQALGWA